MTDYPTRAEIDATRQTLTALYDKIDQQNPVAFTAASALQNAVRICANLDAFPGLHYPAAEPEPEPKPTALQALRAAHERALGHGLTAETGILGVAVTYAEENPEWFTDWRRYYWPSSALIAAANEAQRAGDGAAEYLLTAASFVASSASDHPHLFGGAA